MKNNDTVINPLWSLDEKLYIADGEPYIFNDTLYLYGSRDVEKGIIDGKKGWCSDRYHVVCTRDMKTWEDCGESFHVRDIPEQYLENNESPRLWAPDVAYNPKDQNYYLFSCLNSSNGFYVSTSKSPSGPFTDTKIMKIDGEEEFPKVIDPGVLVDDDGKAYISWPGDEWSIAQLDPEDWSNVLKETITPLKNLRFPFEGPSLRKRGNTYYLIYIQNVGIKGEGNYRPSQMAYMTSSSPLGPYHYRGLVVDTSSYPKASNVHGSIIEWKDQWYVFYHLPIPGYRNTRVACAAPLTIDPDGTIVQAKLVSCGPRDAFELGEEIPAYTAVDYSENQYRQRCDISDKNHRHLFFNRYGQYAGFRYQQFGESFKGEVSLVAQSTQDVTVEVRSDEYDGQLLARVDIPSSEDAQRISVPLLSHISHRHAICLVLKEAKGGSEPLEMDVHLKVESLEFRR